MPRPLLVEIPHELLVNLVRSIILLIDLDQVLFQSCHALLSLDLGDGDGLAGIPVDTRLREPFFLAGGIALLYRIPRCDTVSVVCVR